MPKSLPIENGKIKVRSWHWYLVVIWFFGLLMPPIAILIRFGIGVDLFLNIIFTLMGYIPGHAHNFYCQNIRDNTHRGRSPKWAVKYGLVEDNKKKLAKGRTWAARYDEREASNPYDDPDRPAEDENGYPVHESNYQRNHLGHLQKPAAPMPSESEVFEPASARNLDRPQPIDDDSDEEFYGADHGTGEAPGSGDASRRAHSGHGAKVRKMVTGTNSKQSKKMQQEGRERFEREQLQQPYDLDRPTPSKRRSNRRRGDSNPYRSTDTASRSDHPASSRDALEIDPDSLHHNF